MPATDDAIAREAEYQRIHRYKMEQGYDETEPVKAGSGPQESVERIRPSLRFRGRPGHATFILAEFFRRPGEQKRWEKFFTNVLHDRGGREFYVDVSIKNADQGLQTMRLEILDEL